MARFIRKLNSAPPPNRPNEREGQRGRIQPPVNTTFGEFMTLDLRFVSSRLRAGCWWRTPGCVKALMTLRQPGQLCINLHTCVLGHVCARLLVPVLPGNREVEGGRRERVSMFLNPRLLNYKTVMGSFFSYPRSFREYFMPCLVP